MFGMVCSIVTNSGNGSFLQTQFSFLYWVTYFFSLILSPFCLYIINMYYVCMHACMHSCMYTHIYTCVLGKMNMYDLCFRWVYMYILTYLKHRSSPSNLLFSDIEELKNTLKFILFLTLHPQVSPGEKSKTEMCFPTGIN